MSMNSLMADTIARINNAQRASHEFVIVKASKMIKAFLKVLKEEGYVEDFEEFNEKAGVNHIKVDLKYHRGVRVIKHLKIISRPGCRVYKSVSQLPKAFNGLGTIVVSTPQGLMADHLAIEKHVGGEVICEVY